MVVPQGGADGGEVVGELGGAVAGGCGGGEELFGLGGGVEGGQALELVVDVRADGPYARGGGVEAHAVRRQHGEIPGELRDTGGIDPLHVPRLGDTHLLTHRRPPLRLVPPDVRVAYPCPNPSPWAVHTS
ncbi:hypothetical protein GCM10009757_39510 [Streptomyces cheonanensis]|uniref:Uncharacterized protein n=1 Tax=Streptomyces cheonanensis TaxID=312720 RepID=A0ABP5GVY4_9ACTN